MKKKVFSKLLMGALLVASVSSFTSCKDYDDDINDLRSQINGLNTSLTTTVNEKIATVNGQITSLTEQLNAVKAAYAKADEGLTASLAALAVEVEKGDAANATVISQNASAIQDIQKELVNLRATDANLTEAIGKLEKAQNEANATLKTQGETLVALAQMDGTLEEGIKDAKAQAANALAEAQKAQTAAQTVADNLAAFKGEVSAQQATTNATLTNLQKQISDNLTTVNSKIDAAVTALEGRIKTNETNIGTLQTDVATNKANLVTANTKLTELAAKDKEISDALEAAKTDLGKKITDETDARVKALKDLSDKVTVNEQAIKAINELTIPQLIKSLEEHIVPETVDAEVKKQLGPAISKALESYMETEDIKALVNEKTAANKSLIDALTDRVVADSAILAEYSKAQVAEASVLLKIYADSVAKDRDEILAGELTNAYQTADGLLNDSIDVVAANVKDLKDKFVAATNFEDATSLAGRFKAIEDFFKADDAVSVDNLAEKIKETEAFIDAVEEAAAEANGEILGMITSINLFANQHMAQADEYGKASYTNGEKAKYTYGYENFDHELNFIYVEEYGIYDAIWSKCDKETWKFPEEYIREDIDNTKGYTVKGQTDGDADYFEFVDGRYRSYEDSILVRVSPTNANLAKAEICLINSKGENIVGEDNLVQIFDVKEYTRDGYITRATDKSGLWVIKFKLNDANVGEQLLAKSYYNGRPIVYAVAVKNTGIKTQADENGNETITSEGVDRFVASEFDLSLNTTPANHAYSFDVNKHIVDSIHNRYIETEEGIAGNSAYWTDDPERNSFRYELYWTNPCYPETDPSADPEEEETEKPEAPWYYKYGCFCFFNPGGELIDDCDAEDSPYGVDFPGHTYVYFDKTRDGYETPKPECGGYVDINAIDRPDHIFDNTGFRKTTGIDNRHMKDYLQIDFDHEMDGAMWAKIDIEFPNEICGVATPIKGFFVTLDQQFALESGNSEINAWVNYIYKNVGYYSVNKGKKDNRIDVPATLFKGNKGTIYIKDANNIVNGDVIGFRVHAVNLDGTLYDPDGRAFYVKFGKQETRHKLSFDITVRDSAEYAYAVQDLLEDGQNPIVKYNKDQKDAGVDVRFFQRDQYAGSYIPDQNYRITYTWRGDKNIIRGINNTSNAWLMEDGTEQDGVNLATGDESSAERFAVKKFFTFWYSENANADIEDKTGDVDNEWTLFNKKYADGEKVAANRLTQSVRAAINPNTANRLIDGHTYKITATIERLDAQTDWRVVNIIDIDITKSMPQDLPKAFAVKSLQEGNINGLKFYVRPYYGANFYTYTSTYSPWVINWGDDFGNKEYLKNSFAKNVGEDKYWNSAAATDYIDKYTSYMWHEYRWGVDARQYNFEEFFTGILLDKYDADGNVLAGQQYIDKNYFFEFANTGSLADAESKVYTTDFEGKYIKADNAFATATATVVFDPTFSSRPVDPATVPANRLGGYHLPAVYYGEINKEENHEVKAGYIYRNISANLNEDGDAFLVPTEFDLNPASSKIRNCDWKTTAIAFDKDGKKADKSVFQAQYWCAFDEAVALKDSTYKTKTKARNICTQIKYEDASLQELRYTDTSKDEADTTKTEKTAVNFIKTDYVQYTVADKFVTTSDFPGYYNACLDPLKMADASKMTLTSLLNKKVLAVDGDLDTAIKFEQLKDDMDKTTLKPSGNAVAYNPAQYFKFYFVNASGAKAKKSSEIAGIKFEVDHRTVDLPALTQNVHGVLTFDVVNVWNHKKTKVNLYVKFARPMNQASRQAR